MMTLWFRMGEPGIRGTTPEHPWTATPFNPRGDAFVAG